LNVFTASATLADGIDPDLKLSGQTVSFEFLAGTATYYGSGVTDAAGLAVYSFTAPPATGDYQLRGLFAGDGTYYPALESSTVTVSARPVLISLPDAETRIDELFRASATLTDQETSVPVGERLITFTFGSSSGAYTAADGLATVEFSAPSSSGTFRIDASFSGDTTYASASSSSSLTVIRRPAMLTGQDASGIIDEVFTATATLADALNAAPAAGRPLAFVFSGSTFTADTDAEGMAVSTFTAPGAAGLYYSEISFDGDARYLPVSTTVQLTVDKRPAAIDAWPVTARAAQVFTASAALRDVLDPGYGPEGREILFVFEGSSFTALTDPQGVAVSTFMAPASSTSLRLDVSFAGDGRYHVASASAAVTVLRRLSLITLEPVTTRTLDVFSATATLQDLADPSVFAPGRDITFTFSPSNVGAVTDAAGIAVSTFSAPVSSGVYTVEASFAGDAVYEESYSSGTVIVLQRPADVIVPDGSAYPYEQFTASATLADAATLAPAPDRPVLFSLDGTQEAGATGELGLATAAYATPAAFGDYELTADFAGDATYAAASGSATVSVMQRPTEIGTLDLSAVALDVFIASASITDVRFGLPVEGKDIVFLFEGHESTATTDSEGRAWAQFNAPVASGTYVYGAEFRGDQVYAVSSATGAVTVLTRFTRVIVRDANANVGEPFTLSATLTDPAFEDDQPGYFVPGGRVEFKFKDRSDTTLDTAYGYTNEVGVATVTLNGPSAPDVYYYTARFEGDYTYSASSGTAMVKVGLLTSLVAFDVETMALENFTGKAKLTDYLSTALNDKAIRFTFLGTNGSGMTNAGGDAGIASSTFTAPASSGTYYYNAYFDGDSIYSASDSTATITVRLRPSGLIAYPIETVAYSSFTAMTLLSNILPPYAAIGGRNVELYFNGSTVPANTGAESGVASAVFFAPFSSGTYNYHAYFAGDDTYDASYGTGTLTVTLRPTNMLSYGVSDLTAGSTFTARVQIKDNANIPVRGLSVDFNFEGHFGVGETNQDGMAEYVFTAPASSGTYTYYAVFYGDERYAGSGGSGEVVVGPRPTMLVTSAVSSKLGSPLDLSARLLDTASRSGISGKSISFYFGGSTLTAATDEFGISSVTFASPSSTGSYVYEAEFEGDGLTYIGSYSSSPVTIALNFTQLEARGDLAIKIFEPLAVEATLKDSIGVQMPDMPVVFAFEGEETTSVTSGVGKATATFSTLLLPSTGTFNFTAEYPGDTLFVASRDTTNVVSVQRRDSLLTAGDVTTTPGKSFTAAATLLDNVNDSLFTGAAVSGKAIVFEFHDSTFTHVSSATTSALGVSSATFTAPVSTGAYLMTARFADDDGFYAGALSSATVTVLTDDGSGLISTWLRVEFAEAYIGQIFTASATLTASNIPVTGKPVLFEFFTGITTYTAAGWTDGIGLATAAFTAPLSSGVYSLAGSFAGDMDYSAASGTATLTASRYPTSLTALDLSAFAGEDFTAKAVLRDDYTGLDVAGKTVTFEFYNGVSTSSVSAVTSSTGTAEAVFTAPPVPGNYSYTARFEGDGTYVEAFDTASVLLASRGSSTFLVGYEVFIGTGEVFAASATLTSSGYPVPGKPVTLTFQGTALISTTNASGVAFSTFTAPASSGTFVYAASFDGDPLYNAAVSTGTVLVVLRKEPEQPALTVVMDSTSTVTLAWTPAAKYPEQVAGYLVETSDALRAGWSQQGYVPSTAPALGYTCDIDPDKATYIKVRTKLSDGQESGTSLVVEVPPAALAVQRKPNYYYMSVDNSAWVKIPGEVMDKVAGDSSFALEIEPRSMPGFLSSYEIKPSVSSEALAEAVKTNDRRGMRLAFSYPQSGTSPSAAGRVSVHWFNGVEWINIGGEIDALTGEIYTNSRILGEFALKAAPLATEFTLTKVAPRIFTPDEPSDSFNRARFYFAGSAGAEVTIRIFDVTGALVRRNLEAEMANVMFWNGRDQSGTLVRGGIYVYQVECGEKVITGTVVVAK
ncbi:MAG: hypothetical protein RQ748_08600, partial [Elusimicrobiales bacterium]|nr:hypothetical protein [Elusimicrobiales bacterium]